MAAGALPLSCDVCDSPIGIFPQVSGGGGCTPSTRSTTTEARRYTRLHKFDPPMCVTSLFS